MSLKQQIENKLKSHKNIIILKNSILEIEKNSIFIKSINKNNISSINAFKKAGFKNLVYF